MRALLRFLYLDGQITAPLAGAVPSAACWQLAPLPRAVSPAELARLIDGCDRHTVAGRRDVAIVLLLARLGLRGGEVTGLELGENTNGLLRQYFPKGTRLAAHSKEHLDQVASERNSRPRKTLGWKTSAQALDEFLAAQAA